MRIANFGSLLITLFYLIPALASAPYSGTNFIISGTATVRLQAENFDTGPVGALTGPYYDTSAGNSGGVYRSTDVDIQNSSGSDGTPNVGWIAPGEWLRYTIQVERTGYYIIRAAVASPIADTTAKNFRLEATEYATGQLTTATYTVPYTGGWQAWREVSQRLYMRAGINKLRFTTPTGAFNLNYFLVSPESTSTPAPTAAPTPAPTPPPVSGTTTFKFMQWNIHGNGNVADIVRHIRNIDPDIISVNENRASTVSSVAAALTSQTGAQWRWDWLDRGDGDGVGFLTKHAYTRIGTLRFTDYIRYRRVALAGRFTHSQTGRSVSFITTHLVAPESVEPGSTSVRFLQADQLEEWARQFPEPRLMAGDFNEDRRYANALDTEIVPYYFDAWEEAVRLESATGQDVAIAEYSDGRTRPTTRLDYIFYSRGSQAILRQTRVWPMLYSDHRAVSSIFDFR